jgi:myo-inositol-hexaphosphate 3-phosphohydrolase
LRIYLSFESIDAINNSTSDSAIDIESTGRVNKADVISSLQQSGVASYDLARETLKSVSVDASGKVELEDYVEVSRFHFFRGTYKPDALFFI